MNYEVSIILNSDTVKHLIKSGYYLFGFKAVSYSAPPGAPLIWMRTQNISSLTTVSWSDQCHAYTSESSIITNETISPIFSAGIKTGHTLEVEEGGKGQTVKEGTPQAISILNKTSQPYTCGLSQVVDGKPAPYCAFPLHSHNVSKMTPVEQVLLMFTTVPSDAGTVVEQTYGRGILIDMTGSSQREVAFDITKGWDWGGSSWGQHIDHSVDIAPFLMKEATF